MTWKAQCSACGGHTKGSDVKRKDFKGRQERISMMGARVVSTALGKPRWRMTLSVGAGDQTQFRGTCRAILRDCGVEVYCISGDCQCGGEKGLGGGRPS